MSARLVRDPHLDSQALRRSCVRIVKIIALICSNEGNLAYWHRAIRMMDFPVLRIPHHLHHLIK